MQGHVEEVQRDPETVINQPHHDDVSRILGDTPPTVVHQEKSEGDDFGIGVLHSSASFSTDAAGLEHQATEPKAIESDDSLSALLGETPIKRTHSDVFGPKRDTRLPSRRSLDDSDVTLDRRQAASRRAVTFD